MADNIAVTPGTGATIAADDISSVLYQRVKISQGADGTAVDVSSAAPLQVSLANNGANATPVTIAAAVASTATLANVAGSASSVTLIASNASRLGVVIFNDSSAILYVKFGSAASATSFTYKVNPYVTLELNQIRQYSGIITGIWASATGDARTTELTA